MEFARALVAYGRFGYMFGIRVLLVVARQVHEVNSILEFGFLKFLSATGDIVLFIIPTTLTFENHRHIKSKIHTL
jgi:hypothetical protein